jgi:uncharacterized repeat protein (TIGR01451 family)
MRSILRRLFVLACVLGLAVGLSQSVAKAGTTPNGPVQPGTSPFAGVTFTTTGDIGKAGGLTYSFTGLTGNLGQFSDVEWGPADTSAIQLALNGDQTFGTPGQTLAFSGITGDTATWTGSTPYPLAQPPSDNTVLTRFIMTASTPLMATSGYGGGATLKVTGDFSVNLLFEVSADGGATWTPATDYFNSQQNVTYPPPPAPQGEQSSFLGGFFYVSNAPVAVVSPTSFDFGNQLVGQTSAPQTFMVTNTGSSGLVFGTATASGDFAIPSGSDSCSGNTIAPNGTCTISVTFTPTQTGTRTGTLSIPDNAADTPQQVGLSGTGTQPALSLMPTSLTFGGQAVNTTSSAQSVTVTNTGTADLHVSSVSTGGTNGGDFRAAPSAGCADVTSGGQCTISVTFTPTQSGTRTATINIVSDAPSSPDTVSLSGTGLNSHLSLSPNPMNFGNVLVGQSSTMTLTFLNSGTDPAHITGVTPGGPDPGDFTLVQSSLTCQGGPPVVPAGSSCSVNITFTPGAVGARSATFTFPNDSSDGPQTLTVTGNGTNPGISVAPGTLTFPSQGIGTTSSAQPVVVTSSGTSPLTVSSVSVSGPFKVSNDGCSGAGPITPPGTCTVQVAFAPTALGPASGTLTITSDGGTKTVALSGTGVAVADLGISIGATPNPIKVGKKALLTYTVTLKNAGPNAASGIVISDPLPSFVQFQSLTPPAGVTCTTPAVGASGTLKCNLATLNAGSSVTFQFVVLVVASKAMTITNTVTVTSQSVDPDLSDNQASASTVAK